MLYTTVSVNSSFVAVVLEELKPYNSHRFSIGIKIEWYRRAYHPSVFYHPGKMWKGALLTRREGLTSEVFHVLSSLNIRKAPVYAKPAATYRRSRYQDQACCIFNNSLTSGMLTSDWQVVVITPIHKGGWRDLPHSYGLISLPYLSKVLEKRVNRYLHGHLLEDYK